MEKSEKRKLSVDSEMELDKIAKKIRKLNKKLQTMAEASDSETEPTNVEGPSIHTEIAQRWTSILSKGLPPDVKSELMEKHIPFTNIPTISPELNPEIVTAVNERVTKRDTIIAGRQKQLGAALAAIGKSLELFSQNNNMEILKHMNDAAKILCNYIHEDTRNRRALISSAVPLEIKDDLTGEPDKYLFGSDLAEKIEITQTIYNPVEKVNMKKVAPKSNKTNLNEGFHHKPQTHINGIWNQHHKNQQQKNHLQKNQQPKHQLQKNQQQKNQLQKHQLQNNQLQRNQLQKNQLQRNQQQKYQLQKNHLQKNQHQYNQKQKKGMTDQKTIYRSKNSDTFWC